MAILAQAALEGTERIHVFERSGSRFSERLHLIAGKLSRDTGCRIDIHGYEEEERLRFCIKDSVLLVNATSVGMEPDTGSSLIEDISYFHEGLLVGDVIYHPQETRFLRLARSAGCRGFNGEGMLLYQGAEAFRIWTGQEMPVEHIREKLDQALHG